MNDDEVIECACGCGQFRPRLDSQGRERQFIKYHVEKGRGKGRTSPFKGKHHTYEAKQKLSQKHKGKILSESTRQKMRGRIWSESSLKKLKDKLRYGEKSNFWTGDKIQYSGLHTWMRNKMKRPDKCPVCDSSKPLQLANITGIYNRDFKNWKYLCPRCHKITDMQCKKLMKKIEVIIFGKR